MEVLEIASSLSQLGMDVVKRKERLPRGERQLNMNLNFIVKQMHNMRKLTRELGRKLSIEETADET